MEQELAVQNEMSHLELPVFKAARYIVQSAENISVKEGLQLAEQVRRAAIKNRASNDHSESIIGKTLAGVPLAGHRHAHYFATDEDRNQTVDHLTIYAPRGFDEGDVDALKSIRSVSLPQRRLRVGVRLLGIGVPSSYAATIFGEARRWRSVTPFSLPRFPNRGGGKPPRPRDLPEGQLRREIRLRGLPEPVSIKSLDGYAVPGRPGIPWAAFEATRYNGTRGNGLAGFEIEFAEPVRGPISLGFACHFGLGLFLPVDPEKVESDIRG